MKDVAVHRGPNVVGLRIGILIELILTANPIDHRSALGDVGKGYMALA